jgi:small-conductance mechanosensitive channel
MAQLETCSCLGVLASLPTPRPVQALLDSLTKYFWEDAAYSLGLVLLGLVLGRWVTSLMLRALGRWGQRTQTTADDALVRHLRRPLGWLLPAAAVEAFMPLLSLPDDLREFVRHAVLVLVIVAMGWTLHSGLRVGEEIVTQRFNVAAGDNLRARSVHTEVRGLRNILGYVIILVTFCFVLLTFDSVRHLGTGLLASAGIAGVVLGFAAQRSLATVLAGFQIALSQPIRVDDVVIVEGEWGRIEEITLTYVVVKLWDLRRLIVPINYFIEKPFQNWTRVSADILGTVYLYLDYGTPVSELRAALQRVLVESPLWDRQTWAVHVTDCTERTMQIRLLMSAKNSSELFSLRCHVREELIRFVQERFPEALPRFRAEEIEPHGGRSTPRPEGAQPPAPPGSANR